MKRVKRRGTGLVFALAFASTMLSSCNVTRVITTTQTHMKNGDTIATMTTKTSETYSATKQF